MSLQARLPLQSFATFWGKARAKPGSTYPFHPNWAHGLDVAAAGRALMRARPRPFQTLASRLGFAFDDFEALWLHLLAIHDIGKFSPLFQLKAPHYPSAMPRPDAIAMKVPDPGHPKVGLLLVREWLEGGGALRPKPPLMDGWFWDEREPLLQPILGHHGSPLALPDREWTDLFRPARSAAAALAFWQAVDGLLPAPQLKAPDPDAAWAASWTIAGLTALADWIGSDQGWFPYVAPETDMTAYWAEACRQADRAILLAGLAPARSAARQSFGSLTGTGYAPTDAQRWADKVDLPDGPLLAFIEDVTGGGKTEAALMLAHRLLVEDRADGLYFALPTMATASAMFERTELIAPRLYAESAAPSLTLAHGSAHLHPRFREVAWGLGAADRDDASGEADSAIMAPAWLSSENRKALLADLGVGTIDQAVLAVLPNRYGTVRLAGLSGKVLIVDEASAYDAYLGAELERLVAFHAAGGGSSIILSATLPGKTKQQIVDAWREALGRPPVRLDSAAYPLATLPIGGQAPIECELSARADLCRSLTVTRVPHGAAALRRVADAAAVGACVAWVRNTVDDAIEAADEVRAMGFEADLFHARFAMGDRLVIEQRVTRRFGKLSPDIDRRGQVIVATQVIEQSLDIDFDLVVSDLAPIDALLQRGGRLWRHNHRERPIAGPELVVVSPDPDGAIAADWMRAAFPRGAVVYADHGILWRTARELAARPTFRVPGDVRPSIEAVYAEDDGDIPPALERIRNEALGRRGAERSVAHQNLLVFADGYRPGGHGWPAEGSVPTRLADESRRIRLARAQAGGLVPWNTDSDPRLAWALSQVTASERKLRGHHLPDPRWQAQATAARAGWRGFEEDIILLPLEQGADGAWRGVLLDKDGRRLEVGYSPAIGLML